MFGHLFFVTLNPRWDWGQAQFQILQEIQQNTLIQRNVWKKCNEQMNRPKQALTTATGPRKALQLKSYDIKHKYKNWASHKIWTHAFITSIFQYKTNSACQ